MHSIWVPTDDDLQQYPHVFFTSPDIWDASVLDHGITLQDSTLDEFGDLQEHVVQHLDVFWDSSPAETGEHNFHAYLHESNPAEQDLKSLRS